MRYSLYCGRFPIKECRPFRFIETQDIGRRPRKSIYSNIIDL